MARPLQLIIVVSSLIAASLCDVCVEAVLGRQFTFPENCSNDGGKLFRCEPHGEVEVAVHQQGVWTPAQGYEDRISNNSSIIFYHAFSNDSGDFVLRCREGAQIKIKVKVLLPFNVTVNEGEKATFPCFYQPTCSKSETAQCVKNGQNFTRDKGNKCADGRLSLSPKRDCCPNVTRAEKQDGGDYFCYIQCGGKRFAAVVRLKVNGASTSPPASKPQQA
ncbi:unnamed protein product [Oreochromis niloticus]|nr:unnamed protein product [Mustela putorius furo]